MPKRIKAPKAPRAPKGRRAVVRTHDGGATYEAACACGYRSELFPDEGDAERAAMAHTCARPRRAGYGGRKG